MSKEIEIIETDVQGSELMILREKAQIDIQVSTARAFPRLVQASIEEAIATATMDFETASSCNYAVPRAGKFITGPGVRLAEILLQSWGNMRAETKVTEETAKHVVSESFAWDLQKNNAVKVTVRRSILTKFGKMNDDMITVTGNAANSIAFRNAIFKVIPRAITDKVYSAVMVKIIGDAGDYEKKMNGIFEAFQKKYDKTQIQVLSLVGKTDVKDIEPKDIAILLGLGTALKDGALTIESIFKLPTKTVEEKKSALKDKAEENLFNAENQMP